MKNLFRSSILILIIFLAFMTACIVTNKAAKGFNSANSDEKAIAIADEVMAAMGGRANWDATNILAWNFFGARSLIWNKKNGDVRIDFHKRDLQMHFNLADKSARVIKDGEKLTNTDSLAKYTSMGKEVWINDSYWLVMPFKLKDSGVTLKYKGEGQTAEGIKADILQLTFDGVGVTPQNKYLVYVDKKNKLVSQWDFYALATDEKARFSTPWTDYKKYNNQIMLSGNRGKNSLTEIYVFNEVPTNVFSSFDDVDLKNLMIGQ